MSKLVVALIGVASVVVSGAALAGDLPPIAVPEPEAIGFFIAAVGAVLALRKFRGRK